MSKAADNKLMNILVIAYACEPNESSEPGVGWNMVHEIAKFANVTVITRKNNKEAIESVSSDERITFEYVDFGHVLKRLKKTALLGTQGYYMLWQWLAYSKAGQLEKQMKYDAVHQLTFGISWIAPPIFLTRLPFIWGPVGGGDTLPFSVIKTLPAKAKFREAIYFSLKGIAFISPFSAYARYRARHILFRSHSSKGSLPQIPSYNATVMCETASADKIANKTNHADKEDDVQFLAIGRMTYWKGFSNAVYAFADYIKQGGKARFVIFGDGPEFNEIKQFIDNNNLTEQIILKGNQPHEQVEAELLVSDALLHPSFRDGGSWAIMEGLTYGLPVICLDTSGPADMVDTQSGILITANNNEQIISETTQAIQQLATDHEARLKLSKGAQERIETHYRWEQRGTALKAIYEEAIESQPVNAVLEN